MPPAFRQCTKCHQRGHFRNKCPNGNASRVCVDCMAPIVSQKHGERCWKCIHRIYKEKHPGRGYRVPHHCNYCGERGHNIRTCSAAKASPGRNMG